MSQTMSRFSDGLTISIFQFDFLRFCMVTDLWMAAEGIAAGHSLVVDMEGSSLAHLARVNLLAMKKFMYFIQVNSAPQKTWSKISNFQISFNFVLLLYVYFRKRCPFDCRHCISLMPPHSWTNYWL